MSSSKNLEYKKTSFLNKSNSAFIEEMYLKYLNKDPNLEDSWIEYFQGIKDEIDIIIRESGLFFKDVWFQKKLYGFLSPTYLESMSLFLE